MKSLQRSGRTTHARADRRGQGDPRPEGLRPSASCGRSRSTGWSKRSSITRATLTDEMRYLAGLQRVRYVFYYPDSKDIVLAGPAEGWVPDLAGRIVGIDQRPARRAVAGPGGGPAGVSARRQHHSVDRLLDRSDPGRLWPPCSSSCGAPVSIATPSRRRQFIVEGLRNSLGLSDGQHQRRFAEDATSPR